MRASLLLALSGSLACIPEPPPPWLLSQPVAWGMQASVVENGAYTQGLLVSLGQARTEPSPLDTVEWRWFSAAPREMPVQPPVWIACSGGVYCLQFLGGELPACEHPLPLDLRQPCRLGVGERVRVTLGDYQGVDLADVFPATVIAAVAAWGDTDAETCLQRLLVRPRAGLEECLFGQWRAIYGPRWLLSLYAPPGLTPYSPDGLPPEVFEEPFDTHPVIVWFDVSRGDAPAQQVPDGGLAEVRPGERLLVVPRFNAGAEQDFYVVRDDPEDPTRKTVEVVRESLALDYALDVEVADHRVDDELRGLRFTAPGEPLRLFVRADDGRQGQAFAALHLAPPGAP